MTSLKKFNPLVKRSLCHFIEIINTQHIIFRKDVARWLGFLLVLRNDAEKPLCLVSRKAQCIVRFMHTLEYSFTVVNIILTLAEVEIDDVDRVYLSYFIVFITKSDIVGYSFRHTIQHALEISQFTRVLNFYDKQFVTVVLSKNINTVELVVLVFLITLAFKKLLYRHLLTKQRCEQSFYHLMISLVAQHALHGPVESNVICHSYCS